MNAAWAKATVPPRGSTILRLIRPRRPKMNGLAATPRHTRNGRQLGPPIAPRALRRPSLCAPGGPAAHCSGRTPLLRAWLGGHAAGSVHAVGTCSEALVSCAAGRRLPCHGWSGRVGWLDRDLGHRRMWAPRERRLLTHTTTGSRRRASPPGASSDAPGAHGAKRSGCVQEQHPRIGSRWY